RRFTTFVETITAAHPEWRIQELPFARPLYDAGAFLARVRADREGRPAAGQWELWSGSFGEPPPDAGAGRPDAVDAAWLAEVIIRRASMQRADRADQFAFAQRTFAGALPGSMAAVTEAVREFPRCRMLMLTLERMGLHSAPLYAAAARRALALATLAPPHA